MTRRHPILRGLLILAGLTAGSLVLLVAVAMLLGGDGSLAVHVTGGRSVGIIDLRGEIDDPTDLVEGLERYRKRNGTVAVVLRIDSPGGAVAPAQEIYDAIWRVREKKPVVASLGRVAASGGYYIAAAANQIVADAGTLTGSIGVIMELPHYQSLAEKVGVSEEIVKSGRFKDTGHPLRPLRPEERVLLQGVIDDVLTQFVDAVARGRGMDAARVRELADGRIFTGAQAHAAGLVDRLGGLEEATRLAWEQAGQTGEPQVQRVRPRRHPWWLELLSQVLVTRDAGTAGGFFSVYHGPLPG